MSIRVVLVDDTEMFREGLRLLIEVQEDMQVVGAAGDGESGVATVLAVRPDVVLMDIRMPGLDGVEATRRIKAAVPESHVIVLTTYSDDEYILEALRAGAAGYLLKDMPSKELIQAIRGVYQGGVLILPSVAAKLVAEYARLVSAVGQPPSQVAPAPPPIPVGELTPRESEVLRLVAGGLSNRQIAEQLYLTEGTVKNHVSAIYAKLHARDRAQAISMALRQGLVD